MRRLAGLGLVVLVVLSLVWPRGLHDFSTPVAGLLVVLFAAGWVLMSGRWARALSARMSSVRTTSTVATLLVLLNGLVATFVGVFGAYRVGWDAGEIRDAAALDPALWSTHTVEYFARYPNNHLFYEVARLAHLSGRIGLGYQMSMALLSGALAMLTAFALYRVVRMARSARWGVAALVLLLILVSASPWMAVPYTDMAGLWVPITAVWCIQSGARRGGVPGLLLMVLAGGILGFGFLMKTTPIVGLVAGILALLGVAVAHSAQRTRMMVSALALLLGCGVTVSGTNAILARTVSMPPLDPTVKASAWIYLSAGLIPSTDPTGQIVYSYGGFSGEVETRTWNKPTDEQATVGRDIVQREVRDRGVVGILRYETAKFVFNNGDGMFWAYGEGNDAHAPRSVGGPVATALADVNALSGRLYPARATLTQAVWLAVLGGAGAGLLLLRRRLEGPAALTVDLLIWNMVGIVVFMLLFQGRSRYLFGHVPVMIALMASIVPLVSRSSRKEVARA